MSFTIQSNYTGYTYSIEVYIPETEYPQEGFPIIYVLDGLGYFNIAKSTVELQSKNAAKTRVKPAVVVGIKHNRETMRERRFYDFTQPAESYHFPKRMQKMIPKLVGGAEDFRLFIEKELKPIIHHNYEVNIHNETLFGHSLGGYYVLLNLFLHRDFDHYIALSPSIWWNDNELIKYANRFITDGGTCDSLFIGVGELEGFMVEDALSMYEKLHNYGLNIGFYKALEENHASVVPTVISRAFRFVNR